MISKIESEAKGIPFLGTLSKEQIRKGKERFLLAINEANPPISKQKFIEKKRKGLPV
jgi:hypothetical protein